jgi:Ca2+-binding EF-hand superfamily protein
MAIKYYSTEEIEFIKENFPKFGAKYCSKELNRTQHAILGKAHSLGIKLTSEQKTKIFSERDRSKIKKIDLDQFTNINTPEVAYFLGYLWADGYIYNKNGHYHVALCVKNEDYQAIKSHLDKIGKFNFILDKKGIANAKIHNKELVEFLRSLDFNVKSSVMPEKILKKIPDHLLHYWWRGYFEGDGMICPKISGFSISGPYDYKWDFLTDLFKKLGIDKHTLARRIRWNGKVSDVGVWNLKNVKLFFEYIYKDAEIDNLHIKRKYKRYLDLLWRQENKDLAEIKRRTIASRIKTDAKRNPERGAYFFAGKWRVRLECKSPYRYFSDKQAALNCFNYLGRIKYTDIFVDSKVEIFMKKEEFEKFEIFPKQKKPEL